MTFQIYFENMIHHLPKMLHCAKLHNSISITVGLAALNSSYLLKPEKCVVGTHIVYSKKKRCPGTDFGGGGSFTKLLSK